MSVVRVYLGVFITVVPLYFLFLLNLTASSGRDDFSFTALGSVQKIKNIPYEESLEH